MAQIKNLNQHWKRLNCEARAIWIYQSYNVLGNVRAVAKEFKLSNQTVHRYLIYYKIPQKYKIEYSDLSFTAMCRAATRKGSFRNNLELERAKSEYQKLRRRISGIETQIEVTKELINNGKDKRVELGLKNKLRKLEKKLCSLSTHLI